MIRLGTKFTVKNQYRNSDSESEYEVIKVLKNVCVCVDLKTRQILAMPSRFVKSKLGNINKKEKL